VGVLDGPWPFRVAWALLAVGAGPAFADALDGASGPVQVVASGGLWLAWAVVLAASLVPRSSTLTVVRLAAPAALAAAVAAAIRAPFGIDDAAALALGVAVIAAAALPGAADAFVDGSSYGAERRFALRTPAALLAGPAPVAWCLAAVLPAAAVLLLAAKAWAVGAAVALAGVGGVWLGVPALHRLSRRWLVFVPTGVVVHDHLALADPVLLRRATLRRIGLGPGRTVELELDRPTELTLAEGMGRGRRAVPATRDHLAVAPLRPGAVLAEARARRYPVTTAEPTTSSPS
jgi:hypothetical protein